MNQYFNLLNNVAQEYNIQKGNHESVDSWKARIVYSLLGQAGYASLFDIQEDLAPPSIVHFKHRIKALLASILSMYPDLKRSFVINDESLLDELYNIFLSTGCFYHEPNRITPCVRKAAVEGKCAFLRGQAIGEKRWISGVGSYFPTVMLKGERFGTLASMYALQEASLVDCWSRLAENADFRLAPPEIKLQYLRTTPPYKNGYWNTAPEKTNNLSLARTDMPGVRIYYLYRTHENEIELSQLPAWMTDEYEYRNIAVACLASRGTLPESTYSIDGTIAYLRIGYLFPPAELNAIKLYSWPTVFSDLPHDFSRIFSVDVFEGLRSYLEKLGYKFKEE